MEEMLWAKKLKLNEHYLSKNNKKKKQTNQTETYVAIVSKACHNCQLTQSNVVVVL